MKAMNFAELVPWAEALTEEHDQRIREDQARRDAEAENQRLTELRRHLVECGCPVKDLRRALDGDCSDTEALLAARQSVDLGILVLSGPRGVGKTTAAAWWLVQKRVRTEFLATTSVRFIDAGLMSRWPRYDDAKMRELTRARALVIDDLGIEYTDTKGAFVSLFDEVVNNRYAAELPTLITTNLNAKSFKERYGERVADRIREVGRFVELKGKSMRGAQ